MKDEATSILETPWDIKNIEQHFMNINKVQNTFELDKVIRIVKK